MSDDNLFGDEHVRRYVETDGEVGYIWREGAPILILTFTGRKSGKEYSTPLIFGRDGENYVLVALTGRRTRASGLVPEPRREPRGRRAGEGRQVPRPRTHG